MVVLFFLAFHSAAIAVHGLRQLAAEKSGGVGPDSTDGCVRCPSCLDPFDGRCLTQKDMVFEVLPECEEYRNLISPKDNALCKRSMYKCPSTGVLASLPLFSQEELDVLYSKYYSGQKKLTSPNNSRSVGQSQNISAHLGFRQNLTIVEAGCAAGYVLYNLRRFAAHGGRLICFEVDPDFHKVIEETFALVKKEFPSVETILVPRLFGQGPSGLEPGSVDVFTSSHVMEHVSNPCTWLHEFQSILRPDGIVFTEIPIQYYHFMSGSKSAAEWSKSGAYPGQFHLTLFGRPERDIRPGESPFERMMTGAGFDRIWTAPRNVPNRYIFRKVGPKLPH